MVVSHRVASDQGFFLEKYVAVFIGMSYTKHNNIIQAIILYELEYDDQQKLIGWHEYSRYEVPELLSNLSLCFEFCKENPDQLEIFIIDTACVYIYNFES